MFFPSARVTKLATVKGTFSNSNFTVISPFEVSIKDYKPSDNSPFSTLLVQEKRIVDKKNRAINNLFILKLNYSGVTVLISFKVTIQIIG